VEHAETPPGDGWQLICILRTIIELCVLGC
jgi:hypothetical protein